MPCPHYASRHCNMMILFRRLPYYIVPISRLLALKTTHFSTILCTRQSQAKYNLPTSLPPLPSGPAGRIGSQPFASGIGQVSNQPHALNISQGQSNSLSSRTQSTANHQTQSCSSRRKPSGSADNERHRKPHGERKRRTFKACSSFNPFCINSCTFPSSVSALCSRNASLVLRLAYSRKLYAANWEDWRRRDRN